MANIIKAIADALQNPMISLNKVEEMMQAAIMNNLLENDKKIESLENKAIA